MKKGTILSSIILLTFIFQLFSRSTVTFAANNTPPSVGADSAVLMDAETGEILYSKNMDNAYPMASTTKIMTALLTLENTKLDDVVTIDKTAANVDGSKIYLYEGEKIKVKDLLYALFLVSANDSAVALAEHIGGTVDGFVKIMNARAKELGCENTNFVNPNGLYDQNHKTSGKDLALIMRELAKHPEYSQIASTVSYKIASTNKCKLVRPLWNENKLVLKGTSMYYDGIEGGKTGYTIKSLQSYVASASRNGQRLIVALVHSQEKTFWQDTTNLLNYGYNNFKLNKLYSKGDKVQDYKLNNLTIPLLAGENFYYVDKKSSKDIPNITLKSKDISTKSFKAYDNIFTSDIYLNNKQIGKLDLESGVDHLIKNDVVIASKKNTQWELGLSYCILAVLVFLAASITRIKIRKGRKNKNNKIRYLR